MVVRLSSFQQHQDDNYGWDTIDDCQSSEGEVLVAAKLHSGRKTDLADVLAAIPDVDLDKVESHLHRGDPDALQSQLRDAYTFIEDGGLDHRFKSMFGQSSASTDDKAALLEFLEQQQ